MTTEKHRRINFCVPLRTQQQINEIAEQTGYTMTQCIVLAIDLLYRSVINEPPDSQEKKEQ